MLKKIATSMAFAITALLAAMSLAHADALDDIKKAGKIRIAIDLGVPPYGMTDDKMQPAGLDVEVAKLIAKDWGLEFEHVLVPYLRQDTFPDRDTPLDEERNLFYVAITRARERLMLLVHAEAPSRFVAASGWKLPPAS